jgi:quercetin dioxygenase-like cupin family protein
MSSIEHRIWTGHISCDDVPWIGTGVDGMEIRLVHYREAEEMTATQMRAAPFTVSSTHRHLGPQHAITYAGCWGHDTNYEYRRGTYIFEPVGVAHKFFSGPEPVDAFFVGYGKSQWIDEETGEAGEPTTVASHVARYFEQCEAQGLPRPNILRD